MEILIFYLLISILVSFIVLYLLNSETKIIVKYPKIEDDISRLYVDDNNVCYRYHKEKVKCNY